MNNAEVVDIFTVCNTFPELPSPKIDRDNIVNGLDNIFSNSSVTAVIVEGDGLGKTNVLAQFGMRHKDRTAMLFIKSTSRWGYDPEYLRNDLANQLYWILHRQEINSEDEISEVLLRNSYTSLHKMFRKKRDIFYFIVDGIDQLENAGVVIQKLIFDLLPWGFPNFKFLLSGDSLRISPLLPKGVIFKSHPLPYFTFDETRKYFSSIEITDSDIEEIYRICQGVPSRLASIRRILQFKEMDINILLKHLPSHLPDLFEIEWRKLDQKNLDVSRIVAVIAHDRGQHTVDRLTYILATSTDFIRDSLRPLSFLIVDESTGKIGFVSETFRTFAADRLRHMKREVASLLIDSLVRKPDSSESLSNLPGYLKDAERYNELLDYLSPEHLRQILEKSQSLRTVKETVGLGFDAARQLRRDDALIRFSMQRSALTELAQAKAWRSEVAAYMAVKDYASAINLAQKTVFQEDRLHLLTVIARTKRQQNVSIERELLDQISHLYEQIDWSDIGERAIDIASDLLYTYPDLAIDLIKQANRANAEGNAFDWALAKMYFKTQMFAEENENLSGIHEMIDTRIKDPLAKSFSFAMSDFIKNYSASEIIRESEKFEKPENTLQLLRRWAAINRRRDDAIVVVEYALNLLIRTTPYSPNARDLRQIASPLPFINDESKVRFLIRSFDSQKVTIATVGPTEDYVELMLLLAEAEFRYDFDTSRNRLVESYFYIIEITDLSVKASCMARFVATLSRLDPARRLEILDRAHSSAENDLANYIDLLLASTADHYQATKGVIEALAPHNFQLAHDIAMKLNIGPRRDMALRDVAITLIKCEVTLENLIFMKHALDKFEDPEIREEVLEFTFAVIAKCDVLDEKILKESLTIIKKIDDIHDLYSRCRTYCSAFAIIERSKFNSYNGLLGDITKKIEVAWKQIDVAWNRIDMGFEIATILAPVSLEISQKYIERTQIFRDSVSFDTEWTATSYISSIRLALRTYSGLLLRHYETPEHLDAISDVIEQIPSYGERAKLWSELVLYYAMNRRFEDAKKLVSQYLRPLIEVLSQTLDRYYFETLIEVAPALYVGHKITALEAIDKLSLFERDRAYWNICLYLFYKCLVSEPYDYWAKQGLELSYEEIVDICDIINRIDMDTYIYQAIELITDTLYSRNKRHQYTRQQRSDIIERLENIVHIKLPNTRYIKHEGWKIAAQANIERVKQFNSNFWDNLIDRGKSISNISDSVFVLGTIASLIPSKDPNKKERLLEEIVKGMENVPLTIDKMTRYESLALMNTDNPQFCSRCLKSAMDFAAKQDAFERISYQRKIIDMAYRIDPDLAASLASLSDNDPARDILNRHIQILEMKQEIASKRDVSQSTMRPADISQVSWKLLASLNANRINDMHFDRTRQFIEAAIELPLSEAYPVFSWVVQNAVRRFANTEQGLTHLRPMFEATLLGVELAARVAARSALEVRRLRSIIPIPSNGTRTIFGAGERDKVLAYLRSWFEQHVRSYLKICDQYFGPEDLDLLNLLLSVRSDCAVSILTSQKNHNDKHITQPAEQYRQYWRKISDQEPPATEIVIVGLTSTKMSPIHDRWWLTEGAGLRVGTSFNSLGITQESTITPLSNTELVQCEEELDKYLSRKRDYNGERLEYTSVTL